MKNTNPNATSFDSVYSHVKDEFGEETVARWKMLRILITVDHDNHEMDTIHIDPPQH